MTDYQNKLSALASRSNFRVTGRFISMLIPRNNQNNAELNTKTTSSD